MTTQTRTISIPEQLQDWRPACGMTEAWPRAMSECGNEATLAVIHHNRCGIAISCASCYREYLMIISNWAQGTCNHCCKVCGQDLNDPLSEIRIEAL